MCKQALPILEHIRALDYLFVSCVFQRIDCSLACRNNERCHETVATRVDFAGWLCPAASSDEDGKSGEGRTAASELVFFSAPKISTSFFAKKWEN